MTSVPIMHSPIHGVIQSATAISGDLAGPLLPRAFGDNPNGRPAVGILDRSHHGLIMVEGPSAEDLLASRDVPRPREIGRGTPSTDGNVYRLRADQFAVFTRPETVEIMLATLRSPLEDDGHVTVTDITHGRAQIQLIGVAAVDLLSRVCALDFNPNRFPNLSASQTNVANTTQLVIRNDLTFINSIIPAFVLTGARSLGAYLWKVLLEAGSGLGIQSIGPDDLSVSGQA